MEYEAGQLHIPLLDSSQPNSPVADNKREQGEFDGEVVTSDTESQATADDKSDTAMITSQAIAATLHSLNADIMAKINFDQLYPHLNQADILPPESVPDFMGPLAPDNTGAKINNLIMWLHCCTHEKFLDFIWLLRKTSPQAGEAHNQIASAIENKYYEFRENPNPITSGLDTRKTLILRDLVHHDGNRQLDFLSADDRRRIDGASCRRIWREYNCTRWICCHLICWGLILSSSGISFTLLSLLPDLNSSSPRPSLVAGSSLLEMDLGIYTGYMSGLSVGMNDCNGSIFLFQDTNCDFLADAIVTNSCTGCWLGQPPLYLLNGSTLFISYITGINHSFAIIKSLEAYRKYLDLRQSLLQGKLSSDLPLMRLCDKNTSVDSNLRNNTVCYNSSKEDLSFDQPDFYTLILDSKPNPDLTLTIKSYNVSYLREVAENYPIKGETKASLLIANFFSFNRENCYVLESNCSSHRLSDVLYEFNRRKDIFVPASAFIAMCVLAAVILTLCHVRYTHGKMETARGSGEVEEPLMGSGKKG